MVCMERQDLTLKPFLMDSSKATSFSAIVITNKISIIIILIQISSAQLNWLLILESEAKLFLSLTSELLAMETQIEI